MRKRHTLYTFPYYCLRLKNANQFLFSNIYVLLLLLFFSSCQNCSSTGRQCRTGDGCRGEDCSLGYQSSAFPQCTARQSSQRLHFSPSPAPTSGPCQWRQSCLQEEKKNIQLKQRNVVNVMPDGYHHALHRHNTAMYQRSSSKVTGFGSNDSNYLVLSVLYLCSYRNVATIYRSNRLFP